MTETMVEGRPAIDVLLRNLQEQFARLLSAKQDAVWTTAISDSTPKEIAEVSAEVMIAHGSVQLLLKCLEESIITLPEIDRVVQELNRLTNRVDSPVLKTARLIESRKRG
jgi:hypothetical protein